MVWWRIRSHLWDRHTALPEDSCSDRMLAASISLPVEVPVVSRSVPLASALSGVVFNELVTDVEAIRERSSSDREVQGLAMPVVEQLADLQSYLLDAASVRQEASNKFTFNLPFLCWHGSGGQQEPHRLACDLWMRVCRLCSMGNVVCQRQVRRHKRGYKFIGCYDVLDASDHGDSWGYEVSCCLPGEEDDGFLYIYPCVGLYRQHPSVSSLLVKSNSLFFVRQLWLVLSSELGCTLDSYSDPDNVLPGDHLPLRSAVTRTSVLSVLHESFLTPSVPGTWFEL